MTAVSQPQPPTASASTGGPPLCRLAAHAFAGEHGSISQAQASPSAFVEWCVQNKLPLLALVDDLPGWMEDHDAFQTALAAERAWYETQRGEYVQVRNAWLERGIPCVMIKSAGNQPAFPHTSDNIDILVRREHGRAARDVLRDLGYVEVRNVEEPQKFLFRKFHGGMCVSAIHVHEQIAWFVGFLDDSEVWERMRPSEDDPLVNVPSPEDAILINLAHACYENKTLRFNDVLRVRHSLATMSDALDWGYLERIATRRGWLDGLAFMLLIYAAVERDVFGFPLIAPAQVARLESIIRSDALVWSRLTELRGSGVRDLPLDLSYLFCKRLYYRKILADPMRSIRARWRDVAVTLAWGIKLKSRIRPQPGFIVTLSGVDGTGKTAHAEALVKALRLCELKADYVWSRGGSTGVFTIISAARRRAGSSQENTMSDSVARRQGRLARPLVSTVWAWLVAFDQLVTWYRRVRWPAWRGRIVIADRYVYDTAVELDASLPTNARAGRLAIGALLRCAPIADLSYVLDVSPPTAERRKPLEIWHQGIEAERCAYRALADRYGLRLLSTEGDFAASNDLLIQEMVMTFMGRFATRLNAVFIANPRQKNVPDPFWVRRSTA